MGNYSLQLDQIRVFHKMWDSAQEEQLERNAVESLTPYLFKINNKKETLQIWSSLYEKSNNIFNIYIQSELVEIHNNDNFLA